MLKEVSIQDLDDMRRWRNSPEVRQVMFTDHQITKEEHLAWWDRVEFDITKKQLLFLWEGKGAGVVNIFDINQEKKECHWGFYLSSDIADPLQRMKIWQLLEKEAIEYVFDDLGCDRLICESFEFNQPVIEMHKRFGFIEVSKEAHDKAGKAENVIVTELTKQRYHEYYKESNSKLNEINFSRLSIKIAFMGSSNLDFISSVFRDKATAYNIHCESTDVPFGQYMMLVNDPESSIRKQPHDYFVFIERIEDFIKTNDTLTENILDDVQKRWTEYLNFIRNSRSQLTGVYLVGNPVSMTDWISSIDPNVEENVKINVVLDNMNQQLADLCAELPDTHIIDLSRLIRKVGNERAQPGKYWYMARAPFSAHFNECLSQNLVGMILSLEGKTARVIALDLDNTLWKGVIGDDGLEGIEVGGDYPGNVYQSIQSVFKVFRDRGIALVLCSKNTEEIAFEVFDKHPAMLLKKEDLTAWRINWVPKPENIRALSEELDLGLSSFCFIDDNPLEREEVSLSLPEVFVPELPKEISDWPDYIANLPELSDIGLTDEDRKRVDQYNIRTEIKRYETQSESRENFLLTLEMKVKMEPFSFENQQRILQLIKKTNQFNATTRRYSEIELKTLIKQGECFAVRLKDRLGSDEIIGVLIIVFENSSARIDTLLLSCRVLGRGVETSVLSWLCNYLGGKNIDTIIGEIIPTEKNTPVRDIYSQHGFNSFSEKLFKLVLTDQEIKMPAWIRME